MLIFLFSPAAFVTMHRGPALLLLLLRASAAFDFEDDEDDAVPGNAQPTFFEEVLALPIRLYHFIVFFFTTLIDVRAAPRFA